MSLTTQNPQGLGYQQGLFSGQPGAPIAQDFFDAAFAGRIHSDKIYKEAYNCNIVGTSTMSSWMDEYMGFETDCYKAYTLIETNDQLHQIKATGDVTVPVRPGTAQIGLAAASHFVSGAYVLPQVGNSIVLSPSGELAEVTAITHASANDTKITVKLRNPNALAQTVKQHDVLLVLSGSFVDDCEGPSGQFRFDDMPIEHDIEMISIGDKGELCGDALLKCQYLKIPFTDENGNTIEKWYTKALADMYRDFETRKHFERLLNPTFGLIPVLKSRGLKFTPASPTEITTDDIRSYKSDLDAAGVICREYAIFAGKNKFSQYQRMLLQAGVTQLLTLNVPNPMADCKWIDMQYCGISVEGLTLHIYEEKTFSNGKVLGGPNMVFPNSSIWVPMGNNPTPPERSISTPGRENAYDQKMLTTVYFKDLQGRVWDNLTDSNGVLGTRNTFGAGVDKQEWTIKSCFTQEVHCAQAWGYEGL